MENYTFKNNAKEEFKFFIDEKDNMCLNIRFEKELIAAFILRGYEVEELKNFLNKSSC